MVLGPASRRRVGAQQDGRIRRDSSLRSSIHQVCGHQCSSVETDKQQTRPSVDFQQDGIAAQRGHGVSGSEVCTATPRRPAPIQVAARGSQQGLCHRGPKATRHTTPGSLEDSRINKEVREGGTPGATHAKLVSKGARRGLQGCGKNRKNGPMPALSVGKSLVAMVFLEMFSGTGRLGSAVSQETGWPTLLWDIRLGDNYDLTAPHNRRKIAEWIRCGYVLGFHLGTPCESFSRARDVPPGPPPLRSNSQPLGLPNLKPRDQLKVQRGNLFMRFSAFLLSLACRFCIPATLENPQWSRLWLCPPILAILRRRQVSLVMTTFCAWGSPFFQRRLLFLACMLICGDFKIINALLHVVGFVNILKPSTSRFKVKTLKVSGGQNS